MKKPSFHNPLDEPKGDTSKAVNNAISSPGIRRRKVLLFQLIVEIMILAFSILTLFVLTGATSSIDLYITKGLQSINNPIFSWVMTSLSWPGFSPQCFIITLIIIVPIYVLGYHWEAAASLIASVIVELLNLIIKTLVHRARPSSNLIHVSNLLNSYSFPSGHVMFYTGFFGFICFLTFTLLKPSWIRDLLLIILGSAVALIGLSRIYLGEHWASDVVGAYLLGGICLIGFIYFYRWGKLRFFI